MPQMRPHAARRSGAKVDVGTEGFVQKAEKAESETLGIDPCDIAAVKTLELVGEIDEAHRLHADVPEDVPPGQVRVFVLLAEEDDAGSKWAEGIAGQWVQELEDAQEDIYTLEDGRPLNTRGDLPG